MPNNIERTEILVVRLAEGATPDGLKKAVESRVGGIDGELFSWLEGRWCYLSGGYEAMLASRLGGAPIDHLFVPPLAAEVLRIPLAELNARQDRRTRTVDFLRDATATGVAPPGVVGNVAKDGGREVALDWQITVTGIDAAWALFATPPGSVPWRDVLVGHIDTGCTRHPALGFKDGASTYVRTDLGCNYFADYLPTPDPTRIPPPPPEEDGPFDNLTGANGGHGTRTLSVLAGFYDSPDDELPPFYGAAPGVGVVPYRVTDSVLIDHVQRLIARAIDDAVAKGCHIISMSLGGIVPYKRLSDAIDRAHEAGVIVCAAAGNVISEVTYPGRYNRVITVGGVSPDDATGFRPWDGASRGQFVDVCGPANGVRRASIERRKGELVSFIAADGNGTSYATALCAGIAALWLAKQGNALDGAYSQPWMKPAAFKRLIKETAECPAGWDTGNWGHGLYRADKLLAAPLPAEGSLHQEAKAADPFDASA